MILCELNKYIITKPYPAYISNKNSLAIVMITRLLKKTNL